MENDQEIINALINNSLDWYVCHLITGNWELKHSTQLSSILQCGHDPNDYGIEEIQQCWNGEDLSDN